MKIAKNNQRKTGWLGKDDHLKIALHLSESDLPNGVDPDEVLKDCAKYVGNKLKKLPASVRPILTANLVAEIVKHQAA